MASVPMAKSVAFISVILLVLPLVLCTKKDKAYIVYFGEHTGSKALHEIEDHHHSYLLSVKHTKEAAKASLLYSYKHTINGFAAVLSPEEASKLKAMKEVVAVIPNQEYTMHTTRSWEFSGVVQENPTANDLVSLAKDGENIIVGMIDSGIWPESQSFSDEGMAEVPKSWKGICQNGTAFNSSHCNRKIIGARYYLAGYESSYGPLNEDDDYKSPRDKFGHGTHTASTVGGRRVHNVTYNGVANGTASGGAPKARLAIYKVCWAVPNANGNTCFSADIFAAMDDAIGDGVNVMSISLGGGYSSCYMDDAIAVGALHALKKNIVVSASAGNSGPASASMVNTAPWIMTVAASTIDREFFSNVRLATGATFQGMSSASSKLENKTYPLVYAGDIVNANVPQNQRGRCLPEYLSPEKAKGKIVLCIRAMGEGIYTSGREVKRAGGAGMILANIPELGCKLNAYPHFLPATLVSYEDANTILNYINYHANPEATILPSTTVYGSQPAPQVAGFSSRGPNFVDPYFLKPDITAPGVSILAAWSGADPPSKQYNLLSGTSMSCPHVSGAIALLKAAHPDWSSAAIRSALMTTAAIKDKKDQWLLDEADGSIATPFAFGAGHFQPTKAADPGLVYDANYTDYLHYLCSLGLDGDPTFQCPEEPLPSYDLNYPTIAIPYFRGQMTVMRTVTNVGKANSTYTFSSTPPAWLNIMASPNVLQFERVGEQKNFTITIYGNGLANTDRNGYAFGYYTWNDGVHEVRSTVAVAFG